MIAAIGADSLRTGNTRRCGEDRESCIQRFESDIEKN